MTNEIKRLREALEHYENCVDVCAAEHIMGKALEYLARACNVVALECCNQLTKMLED